MSLFSNKKHLSHVSIRFFNEAPIRKYYKMLDTRRIDQIFFPDHLNVRLHITHVVIEEVAAT